MPRSLELIVLRIMKKAMGDPLTKRDGKEQMGVDFNEIERKMQEQDSWLSFIGVRSLVEPRDFGEIMETDAECVEKALEEFKSEYRKGVAGKSKKAFKEAVDSFLGDCVFPETAITVLLTEIVELMRESKN